MPSSCWEPEKTVNLPSGTVTFLFTDIEGSTKLAQLYPHEMPVLLARHNQILHQAIEVHNGYVFQVVGDSFTAAFHSANDALNAAVDAQRKLCSEAWTPAPIKVRMGIHTGAAQLQIDSNDNAYSGYATIASTQRIMSAGYGGQVLISGASRELVRDVLPADTELMDIGEKRLKDLFSPEHLYQLKIAGLPSTFPPLKTLDTFLNNLPTQLTTFIGREKEVEQIKKQLEKNRLVTLTGSGGVGKTRLSIQVASRLLEAYPNGVWLVELAPITSPALVMQAVCAALDVTPQGNVSPLTVLNDYLRAKKVLLVVDNCEHLIDACAQLCESLLHACPQLHIIASSREALGIEGENAYRVPSLSLPDPQSGLATIQESEAVKLFMERVKALLPEFELTESNASSITQICQRLDGIALAIELAASRAKILKVEQIASRLDNAFRLLTGGSRTALPRQQTLRGTIDWSYNLLSDEERTVLRCLSVFVGGWTLEAAESVFDNPNILDLLTHLVDKSLVVVDLEHGNETRYYLLETIRQYAREKLAENGEGEQLRAKHLDYFLTLAQKAEPHFYGMGQIEWLQKIEDEHENMYAALEWSLHGDISACQQLAASLFWSWHLQGVFDEGYNWLLKMLQLNPSDETPLHAKLLYAAGELAFMAGYSESAIALLNESVTLYAKKGDEAGRALPLITLGHLAVENNDAYKFFSESLELNKRSGNKWGLRMTLIGLGDVAWDKGELGQAWKYFEESLLIAKEIEDQDGISFALLNLGSLAEEQGDSIEADKLYKEALRHAEGISKPVIRLALQRLGIAAVQNGDYEKSKELFEKALEISQKIGNQSGVAGMLRFLGWVECFQGEHLKARSLYTESLQFSSRTNRKGDIATCLIHIGKLLLKEGSPENFARLLGMAEGILLNIQSYSPPFIRTETEQFTEIARAKMGNESYIAAYEAGKQMSLDEAVAYALKELGQ